MACRRQRKFPQINNAAHLADSVFRLSLRRGQFWNIFRLQLMQLQRALRITYRERNREKPVRGSNRPSWQHLRLQMGKRLANGRHDPNHD